VGHGQEVSPPDSYTANVEHETESVYRSINEGKAPRAECGPRKGSAIPVDDEFRNVVSPRPERRFGFSFSTVPPNARRYKFRLNAEIKKSRRRHGVRDLGVKGGKRAF